MGFRLAAGLLALMGFALGCLLLLIGLVRLVRGRNNRPYLAAAFAALFVCLVSYWAQSPQPGRPTQSASLPDLQPLMLALHEGRQAKLTPEVSWLSDNDRTLVVCKDPVPTRERTPDALLTNALARLRAWYKTGRSQDVSRSLPVERYVPPKRRRR